MSAHAVGSCVAFALSSCCIACASPRFARWTSNIKRKGRTKKVKPSGAGNRSNTSVAVTTTAGACQTCGICQERILMLYTCRCDLYVIHVIHVCSYVRRHGVVGYCMHANAPSVGDKPEQSKAKPVAAYVSQGHMSPYAGHTSLWTFELPNRDLTYVSKRHYSAQINYIPDAWLVSPSFCHGEAI